MWLHTCLSEIGCDDVVGPEGMEKFCEDIGVEPENVSRFFFVFCFSIYIFTVILGASVWSLFGHCFVILAKELVINKIVKP